MNQNQKKKVVQNLSEVQKRVQNLSVNKTMQPRLLIVSKKQCVTVMRLIYNCGMRHFAENRVQELIEKIPKLPQDICWHYIGKLQSNKLRKIAQHSNWLHTLSSIKYASQLQKYCLEYDKKMQICIQINVDLEKQKSGILITQPDEINILINHIVKNCPNLVLRGLMCMLKASDDYQIQLKSFTQLVTLKTIINQEFNLNMDQISMGMSGDMQAAITAGSTMLRVGTAIFGMHQT